MGMNQSELKGLYQAVTKYAHAYGKLHWMDPKLQFDAKFQHSMTLPGGRRMTNQEAKWCVEHCTGRISQDGRCLPYHLSFERIQDMLLFKLTFGEGRPTDV